MDLNPKKLGGTDIQNLIDKGIVKKPDAINIDLLTAIQGAHDSCGELEFIEELKTAMKVVAKKWDLKIPEIKQ